MKHSTLKRKELIHKMLQSKTKNQKFGIKVVNANSRVHIIANKLINLAYKINKTISNKSISLTITDKNPTNIKNPERSFAI